MKDDYERERKILNESFERKMILSEMKNGRNILNESEVLRVLKKVLRVRRILSEKNTL